MAHAALAVLTSPVLVGPIPAAAMVDVNVAGVPIPVLESPASPPQELLPLSWSLTPRQEEQEPQPGTTPPEQGEEGDDENVIVVEGEYGPAEGDPMEEINAASYRITQEVDEALVQPVAYLYRDALPDPIRDGLSNVVRNLREPANFLNFLLQFKIGDALETLGRFAINSTIGVGGLFDVAEKDGIGLPYRRNGFANTLGFYGVGSGPYLYLPIAGATSLRDVIGDTLDQFVLPVAVGRPFNTPEYAIPYFVVSNLDSRLEVDAELDEIRQTVDPYAARRDTYLYRREREIALLRGEEPPERPAIVEEIDEALPGLQPGETEGGPEDDDAPDSPSISYEPTLEAMQLAHAITITRPTEYTIAYAGAEPATR
ncbi:VacJ-like lipoprotein [Erythrobacter sp. NAP1]|uniref:MlaA family lipoprotein n=1 Tax=Erythrobacter sp. NAP1 TaxID=237727 RepID=UPI00006879C9|nr:VacJ family lipoprotein [Erythrobacter sp. NAP1]EAQ28621.1 VacJ-like lipoprotein [Erythrobacter sp. NAP1]